MIIDMLALVSAALFTGAAFYISWAEHPARMKLDIGAALSQWSPSYDRALQMQVGLVAISAIMGLIAAVLTSNWLWLAGALAIASIVPFTMFAIMPLNKTLKSIDPAAAGPQVIDMLHRWDRLHRIRTLLGALAVILYCLAL